MFCRMKSRIFDATPKRRPHLSTNFLRRTRNFRCTALHFLAFPNKLTFVEEISHTGPRQNPFLGFETQKKTYRSEKQLQATFALVLLYSFLSVCPPADFWVLQTEDFVCPNFDFKDKTLPLWIFRLFWSRTHSNTLILIIESSNHPKYWYLTVRKIFPHKFHWPKKKDRRFFPHKFWL